MIKEYNIEYVIDVIVRERDMLFEKLDAHIPEELRDDFAAYEAIGESLLQFKDELYNLNRRGN